LARSIGASFCRATLTIFDVATRQPADTRAKDSDRNDTCQVLDVALSEGQLSMEEHRERVSAATKAATLGELHSLVSDLQTSNAPVQLKALKAAPALRTGGWGTRIAVAVVLVLLGVGIGWGIYGNTSSPLSFTSDPGAKPDGIAPLVLTPPRQLHSLGGLTGLIEQMRKQFGDTMLSYIYRGGWGNPSPSTVGDDDALVDLSKFDAKTVVGVLRGAPETLGIKAADVKSTYLIVEAGKDPANPGGLALSVYVSSDFGSGYIQLAGDGTVTQINYPS
jgi:hypothetical protein